jgi:hypothetical protein
MRPIASLWAQAMQGPSSPRTELPLSGSTFTIAAGKRCASVGWDAPDRAGFSFDVEQ